MNFESLVTQRLHTHHGVFCDVSVIGKTYDSSKVGRSVGNLQVLSYPTHILSFDKQTRNRTVAVKHTSIIRENKLSTFGLLCVDDVRVYCTVGNCKIHYSFFYVLAKLNHYFSWPFYPNFSPLENKGRVNTISGFKSLAIISSGLGVAQPGISKLSLDHWLIKTYRGIFVKVAYRKYFGCK